MYYTEEQTLERIKQLPDFKERWGGEFPKDYWIQGNRSADDKPNAFDDVFALWKGTERLFEFTGTTNPGTVVLKGGFARYNKDGAAVVLADAIHNDCWIYDLHNGKLPALCSRRGRTKPMRHTRDGNRDNKTDQDGKVYEGWHGLNFHCDQMHNKYDVRDDEAGVGWYSAGCQVANQIEDYNKVLELVGDQLISYVLLNEFSV